MPLDMELFDAKHRGQVKKRKPVVAVVAGDIHFGDHDMKLLKLFIYYVKWLQPDHIFLNGDVLDCYSVSKYSKTPLRMNQLQIEIDLANEFLDILQKVCPNAKIWFHDGNHDIRLKLFAEKHHEIGSLRDFSTEGFLRLRERGIEYAPYTEHTKFGDLYIYHGNIASKHSASSYLDRWGVSGIFNHKHNIQMMMKTDMSKTIKAYINGCMCSLTPHYKSAGPVNWQQGWATLKKVGEKTHVEQIIIEDYAFLYQDHQFSLRSN